MRRAARTDANHSDVVSGLKSIGCKVVSLAAVGKGCPDLLVGYRAKNFLLECKDGDKAPSRRQLTPDQKEFIATWPGQVRVVRSVDEALRVVTDSYQV